MLGFDQIQETRRVGDALAAKAGGKCAGPPTLAGRVGAEPVDAGRVVLGARLGSKLGSKVGIKSV